MAIDIIELTRAALFHDIGKLILRSGKKGEHAQLGVDFLKRQGLNQENQQMLLEMIGNHHSQALSAAELPKNHPAYLLCTANSIAAGRLDNPCENTEEPAFEPNQPLESVFNVVGKKHRASGFYPEAQRSVSPYPQPIAEKRSINVSQQEYQTIVADIEEKIGMGCAEHPNGILKLLEATTAYIPSSIDQADHHDISFYDHAKLTAAILVAIYEKLMAEDRSNFKNECQLQLPDLLDEKLFLLVSGDLSGIQDFIYTVAGRGALKSLRGRSFYLEIMVETFIDDLLKEIGLNRASLLYNGGGHFYLLLPNTQKVRVTLEESRLKINNQLLEKFDLNMYLELRGEPCSAHELGNDLNHQQKASSLTGAVFNRVNGQLAEGKTQRYSLENLAQLIDPASSLNRILDGERECAVCKTSSRNIRPFRAREGEVDLLICDSCRSFYELGDQLVRAYCEDGKNGLQIVLDQNPEKGIPLPTISNEGTFLHIRRGNTTVVDNGYAVNGYAHHQPHLAHLWLGNYNVKPGDQEHFLMDFKTLAKQSTGIKRIGVLRADVDNLGTLFINGFDDPDSPDNPWQYANIARYAALSRALSQFFKKMINQICQSVTPFKPTCLPGKVDCPGLRDLVIVYAGGDDVFVVGAWDQVLEFSLDLRKAFKHYTNDKLTFSAGLAIFPPAYPVAQMAQETGLLESVAKDLPGKNAMVMFGGIDQEAREINRYDWERFENKVINEKLQKFSEWFDYSKTNSDTSNGTNRLTVGKGFLYQLLALLREIKENDINIARIAYAIARKEPSAKASQEQKDIFADFRKHLYEWIQNREDVQELMTAITIFVYLNRDEKGEENENE